MNLRWRVEIVESEIAQEQKSMNIQVGDVVKIGVADELVKWSLCEVVSIDDVRQHDGEMLTLYFVNEVGWHQPIGVRLDEIEAVYRKVSV